MTKYITTLFLAILLWELTADGVLRFSGTGKIPDDPKDKMPYLFRYF